MFGYPPIHRLFDRLTPAAAPVIPAINADELAAFTTSAKKLNTGKRREDLAMTFEFSDPSEGSKLPGPIHVIIGEDFDGLIQPLRRA
jgi:hypothetical protein